MDWNTSKLATVMLHIQHEALFYDLLTTSEDITAAHGRKQSDILIESRYVGSFFYLGRFREICDRNRNGQ